MGMREEEKGAGGIEGGKTFRSKPDRNSFTLTQYLGALDSEL